jgi:predicted flap endonuclease-1-like 5' DNA nuclease
MGKFIKNTIVYSVAAVVSVVVGWWLSQRERDAANLQPIHTPTRMPSSTMQAEEPKIVLPPEAFENLDVSNGKPLTKSETPASANQSDDLTKIKGIGPKTALSLAQIGITSYGNLASADAQDIKNRLEGTALSLKKIQDWIQAAKELQNLE